MRKIKPGFQWPLASHRRAAHFSCSMKVEQTWVAECTCHGIFQIHKAGSVSANAPLACVASGRLPGKKNCRNAANDRPNDLNDAADDILGKNASFITCQ